MLDRQVYSMQEISSAHLRIWKEAYMPYHRASEFTRYPVMEQQTFFFQFLDNKVTITRQRTLCPVSTKAIHNLVFQSSTKPLMRNIPYITDADNSNSPSIITGKKAFTISYFLPCAWCTGTGLDQSGCCQQRQKKQAYSIDAAVTRPD